MMAVCFYFEIINYFQSFHLIYVILQQITISKCVGYLMANTLPTVYCHLCLSSMQWYIVRYLVCYRLKSIFLGYLFPDKSLGLIIATRKNANARNSFISYFHLTQSRIIATIPFHHLV